MNFFQLVTQDSSAFAWAIAAIGLLNTVLWLIWCAVSLGLAVFGIGWKGKTFKA